ncbi:MAG: hypothetical protein IPJ84_19230 [Bdellovibrionales bacterium]|nr:hypothetical protein [Bdellovibrionales bacterium]
MAKHEEILKQVKERSEVVKRSDDFGHDTQALLCWESGEYQFYVEDAVPKLLAIIEKLKEQRSHAYKSVQNGDVDHWIGPAEEWSDEDDEELDEIVGKG